MNPDISHPINRDDDVAIAIDPTLSPRRAAARVRRLARQLDGAAVPHNQRTWIIAAGSDDQQTARIAAAIADAVASAPLIIHDPQALDDLTFQRRIPGQRRGGVYLNHHWQQATIRIAIGDPQTLTPGLAAWFNPPNQLHPNDLNASQVQ